MDWGKSNKRERNDTKDRRIWQKMAAATTLQIVRPSSSSLTWTHNTNSVCFSHSVTRWTDCLYNIWPLLTMKICPKAKYCGKIDSIKPSKNCPRILKFCQIGLTFWPNLFTSHFYLSIFFQHFISHTHLTYLLHSIELALTAYLIKHL